MTLCGTSKVSPRFGDLCCFLLLSCMAYPSALKLEAMYSFGMSIDFRRTTGCYVPEYRTLHNNRCDNIKFCFIIYMFSCFYVLNNTHCIVVYEVLRFSLLLSLYLSLFLRYTASKENVHFTSSIFRKKSS
jgi:hypothetical protein